MMPRPKNSRESQYPISVFLLARSVSFNPMRPAIRPFTRMVKVYASRSSGALTTDSTKACVSASCLVVSTKGRKGPRCSRWLTMVLKISPASESSSCLSTMLLSTFRIMFQLFTNPMNSPITVKSSSWSMTMGLYEGFIGFRTMRSCCHSPVSLSNDFSLV